MYVTSPISYFEAEPVAVPYLVHDSERNNSHIRSTKAGNSLFCEGDDADFVYEVLDGVVRTSKVLCDGRRQVLSFAYPGDLVGLSPDRIYHSDCDAVSEAKLRVYHKNTSNISMGDDPQLYDLFLRHAAADVVNMQDHFLMLGRKSAVEKVASFLLVLMDRVGEKNQCRTCFDLPMCRSDIADFLGLTIETVSRTLTKLRKENVVNLPDPHRICVANIQRLRDLAERDT